jgi:hypothetical protein
MPTMEELNLKFKNNAFFSKIKGVTMENNRQANINKLVKAQKLFVHFEDDNKYDPNAIKLFADEAKLIDLGYISKDLVADLREFKKLGIDFEVRVTDVTGLGKQTQGCNILIMLKR